MAIGDYLRIFRRLWWVVLVCIAIGAAAGAVSLLFHTTQYSSTARLFVTTQSGTSVGDAYQNNLFSQERVFSYAGLATSEQVAARAVDQLKASITADELRAKITAVPLPQSVLLDVTATDTDAATAQLYANAVADQLVNVATELETSRRGGESAAGAILVDDASFGAPVKSMGLWVRVALGAVGGLVVGLVIAVIAGVMDSRVRRAERVEEVTDSALIGTLIDGAGAGLIDLSEGGSAVERLRELRTNIQFARIDNGRRPHVLTVVSPSAQDGRSTAAANLAAVFAESGHSVLLVDGDLVDPSLPQTLGLSEEEQERADQKGLTSVVIRQSTLAESTIRVGDFRLLPAGPLPAMRRQLWGDESIAAVLEDLRAQFDYVIIDTPPLCRYADGTVPAALGDGAVLLARIGHTKAAGLRKALTVLSTAHAHLIGVVATGEKGPRKESSADKSDEAGAEEADNEALDDAAAVGVDPSEATAVIESPRSRHRHEN